MSTYNNIYVSQILSSTNSNINIIPNGSGKVILNANPLVPLGAATKSYVDNPVLKVTAVGTATYSIGTTDVFLALTYSTTGAQTLTLPLLSAVATGKLYHIVDTLGNAYINNIRINTSGSDLINGDTSALINGNHQSFSIIHNGASWSIF